MNTRVAKVGCAAMMVAAVMAGRAEGALLYQVTLDTSTLVGSADTFALAFQVIDGEGVGGNTTVSLTEFAFGGGGGGAGAPTLIGGAAGSLAGGITITDTSFFNLFAEEFDPGATLAFLLRIESAPAPGALTPDSFAMSILANGFEIPTFGLADELLAIDLDDTPTFEAYGTDPSRTNYVIPAPTVENVVPEPGTLSLLALGGLGLLARRRRD